MYPYDYMVIKSQLYKELFLANIHVTSDICGNLVILSPDTNCEYKIHINDRGLCFISVGKETKNDGITALLRYGLDEEKRVIIEKVEYDKFVEDMDNSSKFKKKFGYPQCSIASIAIILTHGNPRFKEV